MAATPMSSLPSLLPVRRKRVALVLLATTALTPFASTELMAQQTVVAGSTLNLSIGNDLSGTDLIVDGSLFLNNTNQCAGSLAGASTGRIYNTPTTTQPGQILSTDGFTLCTDGITLSNGGSNTAAILAITGPGAGLSTTFSGILADTPVGPSPSGLGLLMAGQGTLILSGANTYSGDTTVNSGILQAGASNAFSQLSFTTVNAGGTLDLGGFSQAIDSVVLNGGALRHGTLAGAVASMGGTLQGIGGTANFDAQSGTTFLAGPNTYSGTSHVENAATVVAMSSGGLSPHSDLAVSGLLFLNGHDQGVASLSGASSGAIYNICTDGVCLPAGSNTAATLSIAPATLSVYGPGLGLSTTYSGILADSPDGPTPGTGLGLTMAGQGTLILAGINTYTGDTTINGGTLDLIGSAESTAMTVGSGGFLAGSGTAGSVTVNSGGTLSPGDLAGNSLKISGPLTFEKNSIYQLYTTNNASTNTTVQGTATLGDATVSIKLAPGTFKTNTTYDILSAQGGVFGTFNDTVLSNVQFLHPGLSYFDNHVDLTLGSYVSQATTNNAMAVANNLDQFTVTGGNGPSFMTALDGAAPGQGQQIFNQLAPQPSNGNIKQNFDTMSTFAAQLRSCRTLGDKGDSNVFVREGQCYWGRVTTASSDRNDDSDQSGFHGTSQLLSTGGQIALGGPWFAGIGIGYETSHMGSATDASSNGKALHTGAVLKYNSGPWLLTGSVSDVQNWYDNSRQVVIGASSYSATSSSEANVLEARLTGAYLIGLGTAAYLKPQIDVTAKHLSLPGYSESGTGGVALGVADSSEVVYSFEPSIELGAQWALPGFGAVRYFVKGGALVYDKSDFATTADFLATAGSQPFTVSSHLDKTAGTLSVGADVLSNSGTVVRLQSDVQIGATTREQSASIKFSLPF